MSETGATPALEPRFEEIGAIQVGGIGRVFTFAEMGEIPAL
jgi:hypothetical protein